MTSKHPKRCETCTNCNQKRIHAKYDKFDTYEFFCNKFQAWIFGTAYNTLEIVGCASHSSASEPVPEQMGDPWNCTDLGIECPDPEQDWCSWPCDKWLLCHDASIATKARAEVLDALRDWSYTIGCNNAAIAAIGLRDRIESLRQQEGKS